MERTMIGLAAWAAAFVLAPAQAHTAPNQTGSVAEGMTLGGPVDSSHPAVDGGHEQNDTGTGIATQDCRTGSQWSTSFICIRGRTGPTPHQNYMVNINLDSYAAATPDPVALYAAVTAHPGSPGVWAMNTVTHLDPGSLGGVGYELDFNNWACDGGAYGIPPAPGCSLRAPPVGLLLTGISQHPLGSGIAFAYAPGQTSYAFHDAISLVGGLIADRATFHTVTASVNDYLMEGSHGTGIEMAMATFRFAAMHMRNGHRLVWDDADGGNAHAFTPVPDGFRLDGPTGPVAFFGNSGTLTLPGGLIVPHHTPASGSEPCTPGQTADDARYHYWCASPDRWLRVAGSPF